MFLSANLMRSYQFEQNKYDNDILTVDISISIHTIKYTYFNLMYF